MENLKPLMVVELVGRTHQADIAFLNQVEQVKAAIDVFLSHRNHQAEIRLHQSGLGSLGFGFAPTG